MSTIHTPLAYNEINRRPPDLDHELAKQFADYLNVKLKVTVRQNISQLFDDLDSGNADLLATGLVCSNKQVKNYQSGPTYYSVSQQLVYRVSQYRPRTLDNLAVEQLTVALGHVVVNDLQIPKDTKFPELSWKVGDKKGSVELVENVIEGKPDYTIADSVATSLLQRVHPELAVAPDITDEQPVTWFNPLGGDNILFTVLLDFFSGVNEDGTLTRIGEKYLGRGDDFDHVDMHTFLRTIDAVPLQLKSLSERYAGEIDWCLLAAIAYQGPHWDTRATSSTGVRGMVMLTKDTAQSFGVTDCTDTEQSIGSDIRYLQDMMSKTPESVPENERVWFALVAYNVSYVHMLGACALTAKTRSNPDNRADVKQRLPLLGQKPYYNKLIHGYARGHEAYTYVENIRRYQINLVDYLREKEKRTTETAMQLTRDYSAVSLTELDKEKFLFLSFLSRSSSNYLTHSPSLLSSREGSEEKQG